MLKRTAVLTASFLLCIVLAGCGGTGNTPSKDTQTSPQSGKTPSQSTSSSASSASSSQTSGTQQEAVTSGSGLEVVMPDKNSKDYYVKLDLPAGSSRVLVIGDGYCEDSTRFLVRIGESVNYDIVLGRATVSGMTLAEQTADTGKKVYGYTKNSKDYKDTGLRSLTEILADDSWDAVVLQQSAAFSGNADSYNEAAAYISLVKQGIPSGCKIVWNMTWAYEDGYASKAFKDSYNSSSEAMYNAIAAAVSAKIVSNSDISAVVPTGTVIQNIRNSISGTKITRDGAQLSLGRGQYAASLMLFRTLISTPEDGLYTAPCTKAEYELIDKCIKAAQKSPYTVTKVG